MAVIYISHRMDEVFRIGRRVTVLRVSAPVLALSDARKDGARLVVTNRTPGQ